jgi:hypothetical protein
VETPAALEGGESSRERRVEGEPEGDDQGGAPEVGHAPSLDD